jgi:hypothetical protein
MDSTIRRLLSDHLRRHWLSWATVSVVHFVMMLGYLEGRFSLLPIFGFVLIAPKFGGLRNPIDKLLWVLPASERQLGLLRWWLKFGFLGLLISTINLLSFAIASATNSSPPNQRQLTLVTLCTWGILGAYLVAPKLFAATDSAVKRLPQISRAIHALTIAAMSLCFPIVLYGIALHGLPVGDLGYAALIIICTVTFVAGIWDYGKTQSASANFAFRVGAARAALTTLFGMSLPSQYITVRQYLINIAIPYGMLAAVVAVYIVMDKAVGGIVVAAANATPLLTPFLMRRWIGSLSTQSLTRSKQAAKLQLLAHLPSIAIILVYALQRMFDDHIPKSYPLFLMVLFPLFFQSIALAMTVKTGRPAIASVLTLAFLLLAYLVIGITSHFKPEYYIQVGLFCLFPIMMLVGVIWSHLALRHTNIHQVNPMITTLQR